MPYKTYQAPPRKSARSTVDPKEKEVKPAQAEVVEKEDAEMPDASTGETSGDVKEKRSWLQKIKESGIKKTPKDVLKKRRNFRLKKMLTPKPPLMLLHELLPQANLSFEFEEASSAPMARNNAPGQQFCVRTVYEGETFRGFGPSKSIAKNQCAEKVLQYIVTVTCSQEGEEESGKENQEESKPQRMETETPWVSLASLALFKMFNDWQAQGYEIPVEMGKGGVAASSGASSEQVSEEKKESQKKSSEKSPGKAAVKTEKSLPENATEKHPVQLLNEMEGQLEYTEEGSPQEAGGMFTLCVTVKGTDFRGEGKTKKDAKKKAAANALTQIYGVQYPQ